MSGGARDRLAALLSTYLGKAELADVAKLVNDIDHEAYSEGYDRGYSRGRAGLEKSYSRPTAPPPAEQVRASGRS